MEDKLIYNVVNQLIVEPVNIFKLKEKLMEIVKSYTKENSDNYEITWRKVWQYLERYDFIERDLNGKSVLTKEWDRLVSIGKIELYFETLLREKEVIEYDRKRAKEIQEETLLENKKSNRISQWFSGVSLFIAIITFLYSFVNKDSKEMEDLKRRLNNVEQENKLLREKIEDNKEYIMSLDIRK